MLDKFNFGENLIPKIHEEGVTIIMVAAISSFIALFISKYLFLISIIFTIFCAYFFRNPNRMIPQGEKLFISPADGVVVDIKEDVVGPLNDEDNGRYTKIAIFLSCTDVHVNRIPISGQIGKMIYKRGKFINASFDKSSTDNERQLIEIKHENDKFFIAQIAGLVARRIVCNLNENDNVKSGDRFGIIKFGSRVEAWIPSKYHSKINVTLGQFMIGGETVICDLDSAKQNFEFKEN